MQVKRLRVLEILEALFIFKLYALDRGKDSLFERLKAHGIEDPTQYLTFHGLRTWSELHGDLVSCIAIKHNTIEYVS